MARTAAFFVSFGLFLLVSVVQAEEAVLPGAALSVESVLPVPLTPAPQEVPTSSTVPVQPVVETVPATPSILPVVSTQPVVDTAPVPDNNADEEVTSLRSHDSDLLKDFTGVVRQAKPYYCGPAALATVFGQMGKDIDQEKIADIAVMDEEKGTTIYGLAQATKASGFLPVIKKWDIETLKQYLTDTNAPVIIHDIKSGEGHFTVVREITADGIVELSDTEAGNIAVDVKTFEHAWTGYVLIVTDEIDHPLLADASTNVSDAVAKTIWGTFVLVAIGDDFSDAELRDLHYCISKAEKLSSAKQKDAKKKCYKSKGATLVEKDDVVLLEKYGFSNLKNKERSGNLILITSDYAQTLLNSIVGEDGSIQDIRDDINELDDSADSKRRVLKKVNDKLEDMQKQLIRLDKDYKATKSSLKKASAKKQKELKKELSALDAKIDRLESQINAEKKRISGEIARLNKEIVSLEKNIVKKRSLIASKDASIRSSVVRLKKEMGIQNTDAVISNDELTYRNSAVGVVWETLKNIPGEALDQLVLDDAKIAIYGIDKGGNQTNVSSRIVAVAAITPWGKVFKEVKSLNTINETVKDVIKLAKEARVAGKAAVKLIARVTTIQNVKIIDDVGKVVYEGSRDLAAEVEKLSTGKIPVRDIFENRTGSLPKMQVNYYEEFEITSTPGWTKNIATPERFIVGNGGEIYYTPDHYSTIFKLN